MKQLKFKTKLLLLCVFSSGISFFIATIAYFGLTKVESHYEEVATISMPNLNNLNNMYLSYKGIRINLRSLGLTGYSKEQGQEFISNVHKYIETYEKFNKDYTSIPFEPGEEAIYNEVNSSWTEFKAIGAKALNLYSQGTPESKDQLAKIFLHDCPEAAEKYNVAVDKLKSFLENQTKAEVAVARSNGDLTSQILLISSVFGVLIIFIFGFIFATKISASLMHVVNSLVLNVNKITSASTHIATSSQELSEATSQQAASLEETAASLEEITAMIAKASDSANLTATSSVESHHKAEEGKNSVDQMLSSMTDISKSNDDILEQVTEGNRQMTEIVKVIQDIGNKTKVINEIVFQTKLLSFNASVEAARAGEHGKGFAVVAEEVGNLAQMSGNAAKEITDMLDKSISKVETIIDETKHKVESLVQESKVKIESGESVARQCSDILNEIVLNVSKVSNLSNEISSAGKEQAQGVNEINKAVSQLDTVTQQNASTSVQVASTAEELSEEADNLNQSVIELTMIVHGQAHSSQVHKKHEPKTKNNIIPIKLTAKKSNKEKIAKPAFHNKMVAGDDLGVPNRNDDDFQDI